MLVIPTFAAIWPVNTQSRFLPATALVASVAFCAGGLSGWLGRALPSRILERNRHVMFVAVYPLAVAIGLQFTPGDFTALDRVEWFAITAGIGGIALLCNAQKNSRAVLRRWGWGWTAITVLLFPMYGLGLVFLPLAVGYRVAATHGHVEDA